jgi:hypothetical protein
MPNVSERNPTKLLLMKTLIAVAVVIIALQRVAIFAGCHHRETFPLLSVVLFKKEQIRFL